MQQFGNYIHVTKCAQYCVYKTVFMVRVEVIYGLNCALQSVVIDCPEIAKPHHCHKKLIMRFVALIYLQHTLNRDHYHNTK